MIPKTVFKCKWFKISRKGKYFSIQYPTENSGVVVVAILDNTKMIWVKNFRQAINYDSWELPRGFIDSGESFAEAAIRELHEESSYLGRATEVRHIGVIAPDSGLINNRIPVCLVHLSSSDKTSSELDSEISEYSLIDLSEMDNWISTMGVLDGISLAALKLYQIQADK